MESVVPVRLRGSLDAMVRTTALQGNFAVPLRIRRELTRAAWPGTVLHLSRTKCAILQRRPRALRAKHVPRTLLQCTGVDRNRLIGLGDAFAVKWCSRTATRPTAWKPLLRESLLTAVASILVAQETREPERVAEFLPKSRSRAAAVT